ncbi:probable ribose-5-phosphate isomerase 2 [Zea mays]|jgi:ribose 5-phosphate isomerase A|uniref:probable ribose-5-phosphate isomerase 2 n=1 Tax=Zea mays TaxID=4577 RepID=UPI0004DE86A7|nr:probable ribose-5-phosphate isomerase 2 [Zea mays]|eukprot:XP_008644870.1 probable ribose-5-phosphate isomerase 2 [Zea mays]
MIVGVGARFVVIVDASKLVSRLGCTGANPGEVIPFGVLHTLGHIRGLFDGLPGFHARLRSVPATAAKGKEDSKQSFVTDNDNYIIEDGIRGDLHDISDRLFQITGVVEHDMFLDPRLIFPR